MIRIQGCMTGHFEYYIFCQLIITAIPVFVFVKELHSPIMAEMAHLLYETSMYRPVKLVSRGGGEFTICALSPLKTVHPLS